MFPEKQAGTKALAILFYADKIRFTNSLFNARTLPSQGCLQALTYDVRRERDREKKDFMRGGAAACIQVCSLLVEGSESAANCLQHSILSVELKEQLVLDDEEMGD